MTGKQLFGVLLLGVGGGLLGVILAVIGFGFACWILCSLGLIERADAVFKVKIAVIAFALLGLVLGIIRAVKMVH